MSNSPPDVLSKAFETWLATQRKAFELICAADQPGTGPDWAEGFRSLTRMTSLALEHVVEEGDPPLDHRLLQLDNLIVTPHTAFFSQEAVLELEERAAGEVASVLQGQMPDNLANREVLANSRAGLPSA